MTLTFPPANDTYLPSGSVGGTEHLVSHVLELAISWRVSPTLEFAITWAWRWVNRGTQITLAVNDVMGRCNFTVVV